MDHRRNTISILARSEGNGDYPYALNNRIPYWGHSTLAFDFANLNKVRGKLGVVAYDMDYDEAVEQFGDVFAPISEVLGGGNGSR